MRVFDNLAHHIEKEGHRCACDTTIYLDLDFILVEADLGIVAQIDDNPADLGGIHMDHGLFRFFNGWDGQLHLIKTLLVVLVPVWSSMSTICADEGTKDITNKSALDGAYRADGFALNEAGDRQVVGRCMEEHDRAVAGEQADDEIIATRANEEIGGFVGENPAGISAHLFEADHRAAPLWSDCRIRISWDVSSVIAKYVLFSARSVLYLWSRSVMADIDGTNKEQDHAGHPERLQ